MRTSSSKGASGPRTSTYGLCVFTMKCVIGDQPTSSCASKPSTPEINESQTFFWWSSPLSLLPSGPDLSFQSLCSKKPEAAVPLGWPAAQHSGLAHHWGICDLDYRTGLWRRRRFRNTWSVNSFSDLARTSSVLWEKCVLLWLYPWLITLLGPLETHLLPRLRRRKPGNFLRQDHLMGMFRMQPLFAVINPPVNHFQSFFQLRVSTAALSLTWFPSVFPVVLCQAVV